MNRVEKSSLKLFKAVNTHQSYAFGARRCINCIKEEADIKIRLALMMLIQGITKRRAGYGCSGPVIQLIYKQINKHN